MDRALKRDFLAFLRAAKGGAADHQGQSLPGRYEGLQIKAFYQDDPPGNPGLPPSLLTQPPLSDSESLLGPPEPMLAPGQDDVNPQTPFPQRSEGLGGALARLGASQARRPTGLPEDL